MRRLAVHCHLVGCNGVPSSTYAPLLQRLRAGGVNSTSTSEVYSTANADSWERSVDKVLSDVASVRRERGLDEQGAVVVGLGHSLGGALCYAAAAREAAEPSKKNKNEKKAFDSVVLFDPPMFHPGKRAAMMGLRLSGREIPLVARARRRPSSFPSRAEAEVWVRDRRMYSRFHPEILDTFLRDGIVVDPEDGSASFVFSPEAEAHFFNTTPWALHPFASPAGAVRQYERIGCDGHFFYSLRHEVESTLDVEYLKRRLAGKSGRLSFTGVDCSHFWPLEDPDAACDAFLQAMEQRHPRPWAAGGGGSSDGEEVAAQGKAVDGGRRHGGGEQQMMNATA